MRAVSKSDSQQNPETMTLGLRKASQICFCHLVDMRLPWASGSLSVTWERGSGIWMRSQRACPVLISCGPPSPSTPARPSLFLVLEWAWLSPIIEPLPKPICTCLPPAPEHHFCIPLLVLVWIPGLWSQTTQSTNSDLLRAESLLQYHWQVGHINHTSDTSSDPSFVSLPPAAWSSWISALLLAN